MVKVVYGEPKNIALQFWTDLLSLNSLFRMDTNALPITLGNLSSNKVSWQQTWQTHVDDQSVYAYKTFGQG